MRCISLVITGEGERCHSERRQCDSMRHISPVSAGWGEQPVGGECRVRQAMYEHNDFFH